jgi:hypothetical protein
MNWRLLLYRATHHLFEGDNWLLIIGRDFDNNDWGITWKHGEMSPFGDWRCWKREFRLNIRWPISIRCRRRS